MVFAQLVRPLRKLLFDAFDKVLAASQFNDMTLTILKANGLDALIALQGPSQASGRVLATRKKNQCRGVKWRHVN